MKAGENIKCKASDQSLPRRMPIEIISVKSKTKDREIEEFEIKKQLEAGVIDPSNSEGERPCCSLLTSGVLRSRVDYRKLNTMTAKDSYALPHMDECIRTLGDSQVFTTLEAFDIYWQIDIPKKVRDKTTPFATPVNYTTHACSSAPQTHH